MRRLRGAICIKVVLPSLFILSVWIVLQWSGEEISTTVVRDDTQNVTSKPSKDDGKYLSVVHFNRTRMVERQARILQHIQTACRGRKRFSALSTSEKSNVLKHMIVDDKHQLLYCFIPKVGCANWKRVFNALYGSVASPENVHRVDHKSMVLLSTYTELEVQYRLKKYFKFMYVRHPMDRLLSAYRNKFGEHFVNFEKKYGVQIVKKYRPNPPRFPKGDDVTFAEFMMYIANTDPAELNEHWNRYSYLCQPCHVSYDFIGYFEEFDTDVNFLLDVLNLSSVLQFPKKQAYYKTLSDAEKMGYMRTVPNSTLQMVARKLARDFEMFGYRADSLLGSSQLSQSLLYNSLHS